MQLNSVCPEDIPHYIQYLNFVGPNNGEKDCTGLCGKNVRKRYLLHKVMLCLYKHAQCVYMNNTIAEIQGQKEFFLVDSI